MNSLDRSAKPSFTIDSVLSRLQKLTLSSTLSKDACSDPLTAKLHDPPFLASYSGVDDDNGSNTIIIDAFVPGTSTLHSSPTSSRSSDSPSASSQHLVHTSAFEAFFAARSRVVRLYNLPAQAESFLSAVFLPHNASGHRSIPVPATMWELREEYTPEGRGSVWAVFGSHEEACAALSLSGRAMSVDTALERDLEPFHRLQRFVPRNTQTAVSLTPAHPPPTGNTNTLDLPRPPMLRVSPSHSDLHTLHRPIPEVNTVSAAEYTLSSNPPNPKTSFRLGDWICNSPNCAAHNFGRNLACIGCGCPRSTNGPGASASQASNSAYSRAPPSPRFNSTSNNITYYSSGPGPSQPQPHHHHQQQQHLHPQSLTPTLHSAYTRASPSPSFGTTPPVSHPTNPSSKSSHPLLTPSGRAFAIGGKVQNVSSDPLNPCIMYWPDNEPLPEQGQIRPSGLVGIAQPPILNTGNRGPISHQPGDWICQKCNYLNWRRRKVCQTCLPYAEGNGDSISAAVQAERIALLTSVLSQTQLNTGNLSIPTAAQTPRSHSLTPPQARRPFIDLSPSQTLAPPQTRSVHRSQSHFSLGQQYGARSPQYTAPSPIYQTSGHRQPSPLYSTGPPGSDLNHHNFLNVSNAGSNGLGNHMPTVQAPAPLLPSFLQDMVQSPALSPTSTTTSSADLSSIEEYEDLSSPRSMFPRTRGDSGSDANSPISNIWRLDGEESKSLSAFPLPNHHELLGGKKISRERLRV